MKPFFKIRVSPCPRCSSTYIVKKKVGSNRDLIVLMCNDCCYIAAKNGEARSTLRQAAKVWNRKAGGKPWLTL